MNGGMENIDSTDPRYSAEMDGRYNYRIVRHYFHGGKRTIATGLTLRQAQEHCKDPETSSSTATSSAARARTRKLGPWFDGYENM